MSRNDDPGAVSAANSAFYRAFESLDLERMEGVWLKESAISCTHPGWARLEGWGPIMKSWEEIFQQTFGMTFEIAEETVHVVGDLAWVTCVERIESRSYDGISNTEVEATNIFGRRGDSWFLIHHHGSPRLRAGEGIARHLQ